MSILCARSSIISTVTWNVGVRRARWTVWGVLIYAHDTFSQHQWSIWRSRTQTAVEFNMQFAVMQTWRMSGRMAECNPLNERKKARQMGRPILHYDVNTISNSQEQMGCDLLNWKHWTWENCAFFAHFFWLNTDRWMTHVLISLVESMWFQFRIIFINYWPSEYWMVLLFEWLTINAMIWATFAMYCFGIHCSPISFRFIQMTKIRAHLSHALQ